MQWEHRDPKEEEQTHVAWPTNRTSVVEASAVVWSRAVVLFSVKEAARKIEAECPPSQRVTVLQKPRRKVVATGNGRTNTSLQILTHVLVFRGVRYGMYLQPRRRRMMERNINILFISAATATSATVPKHRRHVAKGKTFIASGLFFCFLLPVVFPGRLRGLRPVNVPLLYDLSSFKQCACTVAYIFLWFVC